MKRPIAPLLFLGLVLAAITGPARAEDDGVRAELEGQYQQLTQATQQKDVTGLEALVGPDYASTDAAGVTRSYDQAIGFWKQKLAPLHEIACRFQFESVESRGAEAVVIVRTWVSFKTAGLDGQAPRMECTALDRDVWRKSCDGWRLSTTTRTNEQFRSLTASLSARPGLPLSVCVGLAGVALAPAAPGRWGTAGASGSSSKAINP